MPKAMPFQRRRRANEKIHYLTLIKAYYAHYQHSRASRTQARAETCMLTALNVSQRLD